MAYEIINFIKYPLIMVSIYIVFWLISKYLKKKGYKPYSEKEIKDIQNYKISKKIKILYFTYMILFIILLFGPIMILVFFSDFVQRYFFVGKETLFFYGLSSTFPAITIIFGSLLLGGALSMIICMPFYIKYPEFEIYEQQMRSKNQNLPEIYKLKTRGIEKKILMVSLILAPILFVLILISFNDYTLATEDKITQKYFFNINTYSWDDIRSAELIVKSIFNEDTGKYSLVFNLKFHTKDSEFDIWRDNGLVKPYQKELFWLFSKLDNENINLTISGVSSDLLLSESKTYPDYYDRIYPLIFSEIK
jgi:hypothetical protein